MTESPHATNDGTDTTKAVASTPPARAKPRVWTVFVALVVALVATVGIQIVVVIGMIAWYVAGGRDIRQVASDLPAQLTAPPVMIGFLLLTQTIMGLAAFIPARLSPKPARVRLGLLRPVLPLWGYPVVMVGSLTPLALGVALAELVATVLHVGPVDLRADDVALGRSLRRVHRAGAGFRGRNAVPRLRAAAVAAALAAVGRDPRHFHFVRPLSP